MSERPDAGDPAVGARIRAAREKAGLTQGDLAGLIGVTQGLISQYESGKTATPIEAIRAIGEHTEEDPGYLANGVQGVAREVEQLTEAINRGISARAARNLRDLSEDQIEQIVAAVSAMIETAKPQNQPRKR